MEAVKGLQGNWHATEGDWDESHNKKKTLCGRGISPNFYRETEKGVRRIVNCPQCKEQMKKRVAGKG